MFKSTRRTNGSTVKSLRKSLGIPQFVLAERIGINAAYLSNIEKGARQPSPKVARAIADELGVPLDAITYPVREAVSA